MKANKSITATAGFLLIGVFIFAASAQKSKIVEGGIINGVPYASTDFEQINLTNGNLNLNLPLASLQGRGSTGFGYALHYNSKLWQSTQNPVWGQNGQITYQDFLEDAPEGGWQDLDQYQIEIWNRNSGMDAPTGDVCANGMSWRLAYRWRVELKAPDGGKTEFRPLGFSDIPPSFTASDGGYFNVHPNGSVSSVVGSSGGCSTIDSGPTNSPMIYYSSDGSGRRLIFSNSQSAGYVWELSMPDGSKVVQLTDRQRIVDRNGNFVESSIVTLPDSTQVPGWVDQVGRYIARKKNYAPLEDRYYQLGFNGELLTWKVKWKTVYVRKNYTTTCNSCGGTRGPVINTNAHMGFDVVERIELPHQLGGLVYLFEYHAKDLDDQTISPGWGEVKSITIPTGAKLTYGFELAHFDPLLEYNELMPGEIYYRTDQILERAGTIAHKKLNYVDQYDGAATNREEIWGYSVSTAGSSVISPDGGFSTQLFWDIVNDTQKGGQVYKETKPDGTIIERKWANNLPVGVTFGSPNHMNAYVDFEVTTITDAYGNPSLSTIKDLNYDGNQNLISTTEYDWFPSASGFIQRDASGIVVGFSGLTPLRTHATTYYNSTSASQSNAYYNASAPALRNLAQSAEILDASGAPVSRTEITYDNSTAPTNGNPTLVKTWDSYKGGSYQAYSNPLTPANSISTTTAYDQYGNPILTTDANNNQTQITYDSVNGFTGLYPTKTISAYLTPIARTSTAAYDFYTGVVTTATDVDNNVSTVTEYDALGRPTKVRNAAGTALESWTQTIYDDVNRRVIVKSDLETKGDYKKVAIRHFDQLGRVRLARTLENAATEDPTNETHGVKVETRYQTGNPNSYQLTSNPFRAPYASQATTDPTMGWTRSKSWNTGRHADVETFSGAALPAPWGNNTTSTGKVQTDIDANATTVTDQALKQRRSITNALGQLIRVDEPDANGNLGSISAPNQPTSYAYDTLNNLTTVTQGVQTRTFVYNSLSRLTSATNPESGTINYGYDNNGNLTSKTDARGVKTDYIYDALNRVTNRNYSTPNGTPGTGILANYQPSPNVTYFYDGANVSGGIPNSKGKLTEVASSVSTTEYMAFDILGRVTRSKQTTDGVEYGGGTDPTKWMTYAYNLSGALIEQQYPSGRVVRNTLDTDGSLQQVQSRKANDTFRNYANSFTYTAAGAVSSMRLGNGRWENTTFNSRLQPTQIGLGGSATNQDLLKLNYDYGTTANNGNVLSQTITVNRSNQSPLVFNQTYTYDSLNRLKSAVEMTGTTENWRQTYTFDRYGNRRFDQANTTQPISFANPNVTNPQIDAANNRFTTGQGWTYDLTGNIITDAEGRTFNYDAENKQVEAKNSSSATLGTYYFDGDGKRVKKVVPSGETTIFVYNAGGKIVAEYSTVVAPIETAKVQYLTNDNLGTPRINTDQLGNIVSRSDYMPYGEEIVGLGGRSSADKYGADDVRQGFTGYEHDSETGLDYGQARMYLNRLGRYFSVDPIFMSSKRIVDPQQINLYAYVRNSPLKFIDPIGKELILANQKARESAKLFSGVTQEERDRIQVDSSGRVTITPAELCGPETLRSASFAMIQFAVESATVVRVSVVGTGESVSLPNSIIDAGGQIGEFTADFNNLFGRAGTAVPRTDGSWDVLVPEGGAGLVQDPNGNEVVPTTEMTIFNHEIAHPFGMDAIEVENNVRRENRLPLRGGGDHLDPNVPISNTPSSLTPIQAPPAQIQTVITLRQPIPLPTPVKKPE